jgi:hypothetical protein
MRIEFHLGVHKTGTSLLQQNILNNAGRLRHQGIIYANTAFRRLIRQQMWLLRGLEGRGGKPAPKMGALAALNRSAIETAHARGAHTILISHEDQMGYAPYAAFILGHDCAGLYPKAQDIIPHMIAGFDPASVTLHVYSRMQQTLVPSLWSEGMRNFALPFGLDEFADRLDLDGFLFFDLVRRMQQGAPKASVIWRDFETVQNDPMLFVQRFFRDIGADPNSLALQAKIVRPSLDLDQANDIAALVRRHNEGALSKEDMAAAGRHILDRATNPQRKAQLGADNLAKLKALSQQDFALATAQRLHGAPLTVFFMVEPGPLELQAHLLVSSLTVNCLDPLQMVAFCRHDRIDALHALTREYLRQNGVELRALVNDFADGYPAGNKLIAAGQVEADGWSVFMDTDMLLVRPSSFLDEAAGRRVGVSIDTVNGWTKDDRQWQKLQERLNITSLGRKVRLAGGALSYPLFNAGLVMFPPASEDGKTFGDLWLETALDVDRDDEITNKRPWLDTIALAGALARDDAPGVRPLSMDWNCTTRFAGDTTRILHYHGIKQLREYGWQECVNHILQRSRSPFATLGAAITTHAKTMKVAGDLQRRAMRHGIQGG